MKHQYDVVIVGAGLSGLRAAIELGKDANVAVISKVFATRSHIAPHASMESGAARLCRGALMFVPKAFRLPSVWGR